jgi:hypothetical protein
MRAALLTVALGATAAVPAQAGGAPDFDWAWATIRNPGSTVAIAAMDRGNSTGGVNSYTRSGPGDWTVDFPGVSPAAGAPFITAFRADRWCTAGAQSGLGGGTQVRVLCVDENGVKKDSRFSIAWINGNTGADPLGHLWAGHPGGTTYTVDPFYSYNSAGLDNKVKVLGTGRWNVRFKGLGASGGTLHVTPISANAFFPVAVSCQVEGWGPAGADLVGTVACYDATGTPADVKFYATYMRDVGFKGDGGTRTAYAFAKNPAMASYTATGGRNRNSTGGPITIDRSGTGLYRVTFDGQQRGGAAVVNAFGTNGHRCAIDAIRTNGTPQRVKVRCVDENGVLANTKFVISWVK